jgi:hypothetical protein
VRDNYFLPAGPVEPAKSGAPPLTTRLVEAWARKQPVTAQMLMVRNREYSWLSGNGRPNLQIFDRYNTDGPILLAHNAWPETIQRPCLGYAPDCQLIAANSETPPGCVGLRFDGEGNSRTDYYVDPGNDYVCIKQLNWDKERGKWVKASEVLLSKLKRIEGRVVAGERRVEHYRRAEIRPEPYIDVTTIDVIPASDADYPAGVFDGAALIRGAALYW